MESFALTKNEHEEMRDERALFALGLVLICILAGAFGQLLWKQGMSSLDKINGMGDLLKIETIYEIFTNRFILLGIILYAISVFLWLGAMSTLDVSYMYPLLSLGYVVTAVLAFVFIGENITLLRWAGIAFVVIGCFFITQS
jgi:drug/metabolite transporter (DMT)-like permease